jgi:hypothetical protein
VPARPDPRPCFPVVDANPFSVSHPVQAMPRAHRSGIVVIA